MGKGMENMKKRNAEKAKTLYDVMDECQVQDQGRWRFGKEVYRRGGDAKDVQPEGTPITRRVQGEYLQCAAIGELQGVGCVYEEVQGGESVNNTQCVSCILTTQFYLCMMAMCIL